MTEAPDDPFVDDVLAAVRRYHAERGSPWPYEQLAGRYPAGAVLELMEQMDEAGLLDYGVSLRGAWVCDYEPGWADRLAQFKQRRMQDAMTECNSCGSQPCDECPKSKRGCGHHCNHLLSHDACCWCGLEAGEDDGEAAA